MKLINQRLADFRLAKPILALALTVPFVLAGCATRSSVEQAQASANAADAHAGLAENAARTADGHAAGAQSAADQAAAIGNNAMAAAQTADQLAQDDQTGLTKANKRIAYLEYKLLPHKKLRHHRVHHTAPGNAAPAPSHTQS